MERLGAFQVLRISELEAKRMIEQRWKAVDRNFASEADANLCRSEWQMYGRMPPPIGKVLFHSSTAGRRSAFQRRGTD
jgi:hypothetical protein